MIRSVMPMHVFERLSNLQNMQKVHDQEKAKGNDPRFNAVYIDRYEACSLLVIIVHASWAFVFDQLSTLYASFCSRMDNVSILYADIVGFTQMSANKTAAELVGLLNDLFGRFDKLCEVTNCEKISTLGGYLLCLCHSSCW